MRPVSTAGPKDSFGAGKSKGVDCNLFFEKQGLWFFRSGSPVLRFRFCLQKGKKLPLRPGLDLMRQRLLQIRH
jgi:hypothetical protein